MALSSSDAKSVSTIKTSNSVKKKLSKKSQWSLVVPSFVIHGIKPTQEASDSMPRRLDKSGTGVITPGLGFKYEGEDGQMFVTGVVKDCYDNFAGALQYGFYSQLNQRTRWGLTFGVYMRETPLTCQTTQMGTFQTTECQEVDEFGIKLQTNVNGVLVDIIPMPFFHFSTALYKDPDLEINFKMMSNLVLNEFAIAVPF
jgi:hypothetical protein